VNARETRRRTSRGELQSRQVGPAGTSRLANLRSLANDEYFDFEINIYIYTLIGALVESETGTDHELVRRYTSIPGYIVRSDIVPGMGERASGDEEGRTPRKSYSKCRVKLESRAISASG
jgi:hypothetical protein